MKLQERLKELRVSNEMTLKELSAQTDLSVSYLSDIERGRTTPTLATLETLAQAFDMSMLDLLYDVDFAGNLTEGRLPPGLADLRSDPEYGSEITDDWLETLSKIQMRGKRPKTKREWLELYLYLKRILEE